ncbi:helix-turn-helix domain-containing protein [Motilimonas cestriensis]|uniref:helix-turn-helix domain-containing protein n=1 Tax=Motilimonas cestriensis TaxID=2742685 RepID=UPI003DA3FE35
MEQAQQRFYQNRIMPMLEMRQANQSSACYQAHSHDEFSFGVIDVGAADYQNLSRKHSIHVGDTVLINPGDVHACNPKQGLWSYRMLFLDTPWLAELQQESELTSSADYQSFATCLRRDKQAYQDFARLFSALGESSSPLRMETLLIGYLMPLFTVRAESRVSAQLYRAKERLLDQLDNAPSLTELAQEVGISRYHLIRSFKAAFGLSPHAFLLDAKIKMAKRKLKQGQSIADTAFALGFNDQSHFQHQFKKRLAVTPRQYQGSFL